MTAPAAAADADGAAEEFANAVCLADGAASCCWHPWLVVVGHAWIQGSTGNPTKVIQGGADVLEELAASCCRLVQADLAGATHINGGEGLGASGLEALPVPQVLLHLGPYGLRLFLGTLHILYNRVTVCHGGTLGNSAGPRAARTSKRALASVPRSQQINVLFGRLVVASKMAKHAGLSALAWHPAQPGG
jgi:hypothetical protein